MIKSKAAAFALKAALTVLNVALTAVISYGITKLITHFQEAKQATQEMAQKSKETTDSLKDLVNQYKELGDKSGWDTDDFEQARDINDEILELFKDQKGEKLELLDKLDLENGKYEEQLQLLNDIAYAKANNNLADQESALMDQASTMLDENGGVGTPVIAGDSKEMAKFLADNGIGTFTGIGYSLYGYDASDPESILKFYDDMNKAVELLGNNFSTEALRVSKFDDFFKKKINSLSEYVSNVRDAQEFVQDSHRDTLKAQRLDELQAQKEDTEEQQSETKIAAQTDRIIKQSEAYQQALAKLESIEEEYTSKGVDIYGNISNFDRGRLDWNDENIKKFQTFYDEFNAKNPDDKLRDYSTILGADDPIYEDDENSPHIAFTPMLQTEDGLIPLTDNELYSYLEKVADTASEMEGGLNAENILKVDKEGFDEIVNGVKTRVHGMIAAVEGEIKNGAPLSAADVSAIAGWDEDSLKEYYGETSKYVGYSMHDVQSAVEDTKKEIKDVYEEMEGDARKSAEKTADDYVTSYSRIKDSVDYLQAGVSHFDASKLESLLNSDGKGLSEAELRRFEDLRNIMSSLGFDTSNTDDVAAFVDVRKQLGIVAPSAAEATQQMAQAAEDTATQVKNAKQAVDDMQSAYQACKSAVDEYNKTGFVSVDTLQKLSSLSSEYLAMLQNEDGQLSINTQSAKKLTAATIQTQRAALLANTLTQIQQTNTLAAAQKVLGEAQATIGNATQLLTSALYQSAEEGLANNGSFEEMQAVLAAGHQIISNYQTLDQLWQDLGNQDIDKVWGKTTKSTKSASKSVTDAATAFDTLTKAMKEYNQYGYVSADTMKSLMGLEDKFTSCLVKNGNKLEINANAFRKLVEQQLAQEAASKKSSKSADELKRILGYLDKNVKSETISFEQLTDAIKGHGTAMDDAKEKTDAIKSAFSSLSEVSKNKIDSPFGALDSDDVEKQYQAIRDLYDNTDLFTDDRFAGALNPETGLIDYNSDAFKQMFLEKLDSMATACEETGGKAGKYLAQGFRDAEDKIKTNVISIEEYINGLGSTLENINNRMDNFQSAFNDLSDIVDEYNTYGDLSQDSIQKLMGLDVKYTACLDLQGDKLVFNKEAFRDLYIEELKELALKYEGTEIGKRYAEILQKVADGTWDVTDHMKGMGTEVEKLKSGLSDLKDIFSSMLSLFEKFNTDKDNDLKLWGEAMTEDIDKRIEALNKQKEALEKANDEEERAITLAKLKAELEKARTQRTVRKLTSNGYEWVADESAVKEAKDNLSDQQREWRKEDAEKAIDDQIDKLNELKDKYSEAMNLIGTSLDDYNKKLRYAAQIQDMTFSEMEGRVDEYKNKIIASFTNAAPVSGIRNLISNIESLINTLTKLNNVYSWIQTGEYQDKGTTGLWNTIKGFFNKGKSENINKSFKDTFDAAKKAFNAGKKQLTDTATTGANDVINAIINQIKTSGNGLIETFSGIWKKIKGGAQSLFSGSGEGGGIVSTVVNGFKAIGNAVSKSKIGTAVVSGGGKLLAGAGKLIGTAGSALAAAGPYAIPIAAAAGLGIYSGVKSIKHQKEIWSNKEDGFGKKAMKSVATFFWDISPIGGIVNLCKDIFGKNKEIADNTKNNGKDNTSSGTKNSSEDVVIGNIKGKKAGGSRSIKQSGRYNVDERGPELLVRQPASGRYTYLETGDGVVPADITSRLFDMGGNPDRWFTEQMERNAGISNVQNRTIEGDKITIGDIYIQNPVGGVDDLAREINQRMPAMFKQIQSKR